MTRIGRRGEQTVLVARRRDGYYLSLLEGETPPERNGVPLGEHAERLENGDVLQVGSLRLQFFLESGLAGRAEAARERRFTRIAFPVDARLEITGAVRPCRVLDLSLKGALVELPDAHALPAEPVLVLEIPLEESVRIRMETTLVRQEGERAGLACRNIDVESMTHLRRLVALNTGDPGMLERELAELG
ncbi:MAG: PilZ domain-containing protein [Gammaproteobacteria bacterium]|nr:MAG: PilZ domain-containing protein [Gammaproteobacteria bacterium]